MHVPSEPNSRRTKANDRLISADSHVAVRWTRFVSGSRRPAGRLRRGDRAQARSETELRGGRKLSLEDWDMEAMREPGYADPVARLAAMDRDGVAAEVLYSEVSAFRRSGWSTATGSR